MSDDFHFADDALCEAGNFVEDDSRAPTHDETMEALAMLGRKGTEPYVSLGILAVPVSL